MMIDGGDIFEREERKQLGSVMEKEVTCLIKERKVSGSSKSSI